ncbi:sugar fermentation stimulation protein A [Oceanospirillum multiglobuliferum]|uniref:Sugar fermentation stimulation protein homolog n=1 Tax=Oceanospirillum multiglobuliferum TaxID=64969 RepID=A0A1T4REY0_9GAMM|nr:DNA/RNA nuclease SfsA [Oceanospirillum multiglobuliferum]OPX54909.1 sugar fermentation stimulation protein SfsA [Oceanospirillum multiglobuliferum]SKA14493.1 sugar fermentation stimulation protein A [Oceanospirillum multiglobuliferum]
MQWVSTLKPATLIRRYKRFMADVELPDGQLLTLHCANTGSMRNCMGEGWRVWYSDSGSAKRKYPCSWELSETPAGDLICINTAQANRIVSEALLSKVVVELAAYETIQAEVKYGTENSRIDFLLTASNLPDCYLEVKSATLLDDQYGTGQGFFPDAVTTRGVKHLRELQQMVQQGYRAVLLFCANHTGIQQVSPAANIDQAYHDALVEAMASGVEVLAYQSKIDQQQIVLSHTIPVITHV